ncbi:hypothetical protein BaRGS_00030200, partial [Batillaria attramentaria]
SPVLLLTKPEKTLFTHEYIVAVKTSSDSDAGLTPGATVRFHLLGIYGNSRAFFFSSTDFERNILEASGLDIFVIHSKVDLGELQEIHFGLYNTTNQETAT